MTGTMGNSRRLSRRRFRSPTMMLLSTILLLAIGSVRARLKAGNTRELMSLKERLEDMHRVKTRIVGGVQVPDATEYPFFVNLGACAGALIHGDLILTAAHCTIKIGDLAQVGAYERGSSDSTYVEILQAIPHPAYNPDTHEYDFSILRVGGWVGDKKVAVLNDDPSFPITNETLTVIGMGKTKEDGNSSQILQHTQIHPIDTTECQELYPEFLVNDQVVICAAGEGKDSCDGDSAAPLLSDNGIMVGMVSWGLGCARESRPGVYVRLSAGYHWIRKTMCELSQEPPSFCQPLDMPDERIERVRIDAEYSSGVESSDSSTISNDFDDEPTVNATTSIFAGKNVLKSTYVDIYEYGEYVIDRTNIHGEFKLTGLLKNGSNNALITKGFDNASFLVTEGPPIVLPTIQPTTPSRHPTTVSEDDSAMVSLTIPIVIETSDTELTIRESTAPPLIALPLVDTKPSPSPSIRPIKPLPISGGNNQLIDTEPALESTSTVIVPRNPIPSKATTTPTRSPSHDPTLKPTQNVQGRHKNDKKKEWIPLLIYVDIPRDQVPMGVGWSIVQERKRVKLVPYGSYKKSGVYSERLRVRADSEFTFDMDLRRSDSGKVRYEIHAWYNDKWNYVGGDKENKKGREYAFPRTESFSI